MPLVDQEDGFAEERLASKRAARAKRTALEPYPRGESNLAEWTPVRNPRRYRNIAEHAPSARRESW